MGIGVGVGVGVGTTIGPGFCTGCELDGWLVLPFESLIVTFSGAYTLTE